MTWIYDKIPGGSKQEFAKDLRWSDQPEKVVWHSTEGSSFPSYGGGVSAPHFTVDVLARKTRQHYPLTEAAWALRVGSVSTNTDGAIQIEVIGSCDERSGVFPKVTQFTDEDLAYLAKVARAIHDATGIPLTESVTWVTYPASYGTGARQRLSGVGWDNYRGHLGHQHVPGNTHGDPGTMNVPRILEIARGGGVPTTRPGELKLASTEFDTIMSRLDQIVTWLNDKTNADRNALAEFVRAEVGAARDQLAGFTREAVKDIPGVDPERLETVLRDAVRENVQIDVAVDVKPPTRPAA